MHLGTKRKGPWEKSTNRRTGEQLAHSLHLPSPWASSVQVERTQNCPGKPVGGGTKPADTFPF